MYHRTSYIEYTGSGFVLVVSAIMILLFLSSVPKTQTEETPDMPVEGKAKRNLLFLLPLLAITVLFWTDSFSNRLFFAIILSDHNLSERKTEVALLIARECLSDKETAERLFISPRTVQAHVSQIYRKFGVKRRTAFLMKLK